MLRPYPPLRWPRQSRSYRDVLLFGRDWLPTLRQYAIKASQNKAPRKAPRLSAPAR